MKKLACLAFLLVFGLVACGGVVQPIAPTPSASPTLTSTILVTPTLDITDTPTPSNTPDATMIAQATFDAAKLFCPDGTIGSPYSENISPDKKWVTIVCQKANLHPISKFISVADGRVHSAEDLSFYRWTLDGAFVYLLPSVLTRPSGYGSVFDYDSSFYRLNLDNGEITPILLLENRIHYSLTISPNRDEYLVYAKKVFFDTTNRLEAKIYIHNISSGEDVELKLDGDYVDAGLFAWSPDGEKVAFVAAGPEWFYWETGFTIYLLDIKEKSLKILSNIPKRHYYPVSWLSDHQILVVGLDEPGTFKLDINTNQLIELTPTPAP